MTEPIPIEEENIGDDGNSFLALARRILLSGMGAVNVAQTEIDTFVTRLVERGQLREEEGTRLLGDLSQLRSRIRPRLPIDVEQHIESLLNRMNIPTRNDIVALTDQINDLGQKIEELKKLRSK